MSSTEIITFGSQLEQLLCLGDLNSKFDGWDNIYVLCKEKKKFIPEIIQKFYNVKQFCMEDPEYQKKLYSMIQYDSPGLIITEYFDEPHISELHKLLEDLDLKECTICIDLCEFNKTVPADSRGSSKFFDFISQKDNNVYFYIYCDKDIPDDVGHISQNNNYYIAFTPKHKYDIVTYKKSNYEGI